MPDEQRENAVFALGEMDILPADTHAPPHAVHLQIAAAVHARAPDLAARGGADVTERGSDARKKLAGAEGLRKIIVRAHIKRHDLVAFTSAGGNDDHRERGPLAESRENVDAVHIRQAEIEQHEIRTVRADERYRLPSHTRADGVKAVGVKNRNKKRGNGLVILNDQNLIFRLHGCLL